MQSNNKSWPVNWVNGMNINQSHFVNEQKYHTEMLVDAMDYFTNPFNYGVRVLEGDDQGAFWADVNDNLELDLTLRKVSCLFPGGAFITIDAGDEDMCNHAVSLRSLKDDDSLAYIVLSIDLVNRIPYGEPSVEEMPARNPFTRPTLSVSVISTENYNGAALNGQHLIIGRMYNEESAWKVDAAYIPPSQTTAGYPALLNIYHVFENHLSSIERSSVEIVQKIRAKKQDNVLANILFELSKAINFHLAQNIPSFKIKMMHESPLSLALVFVEMARIFKNTLDGWQDCGKDEMMTYFAEWCNVNEGEFEEVLGDMIVLKYNHNDIKATIDKVSHFADVLSPMFTILAGLDFVGKKIETSLFVTEENNEPEELDGVEKKKKKFSFLGS